MTKENISLDYEWKKIDETRNFLLEEIKQWFNEWEVEKCVGY